MATKIDVWKDPKDKEHDILLIGSEEPNVPLRVGIRKAEFIVDNILGICEFVLAKSKDSRSKDNAWKLHEHLSGSSLDPDGDKELKEGYENDKS